MSMSRRQLLAGVGAAGLAGVAGSVLAACGGGKGTSYTLAERFPSQTFVPGRVRLPISLADKNDLLKTGPQTLHGRIVDSTGAVLTKADATIRSKDMVIPYWAFDVTIAKAGTYTLRVDGDDGYGAAFQVSDPSQVTVPYIGSVIAPFDTPTVDDHRGVDPYCTLTPSPCPFHQVTLRDALASGKPVIYMIGTPAHCQTGVCAPALQFLVAAQSRIGDKAVVVHAEVYTDDKADTVAPAVTALNLEYEPVVYLCAPDGTVRDRIDAIWDQSELDERLAAYLS